MFGNEEPSHLMTILPVRGQTNNITLRDQRVFVSCTNASLKENLQGAVFCVGGFAEKYKGGTLCISLQMLRNSQLLQRGDPLHFVGNVENFSNTGSPLVDEGALLTIQGALLKSPGCTFC